MKKISLNVKVNALSRSEMKNIFGGKRPIIDTPSCQEECGTADTTGVSCSSNTSCPRCVQNQCAE